MRISTALKGVRYLCLDTAPFIYFVDKYPAYIERMHLIFQGVSSGTLEVITSTITLTEVLHKPVKIADTALVESYFRFLLNTRRIRANPVTPAIASHAARLRAQYNLKTPDALQVATALETGCDAFLTNDRGIKRVTELPILIVEDLELDPLPEPA